ncbi:MAG: TRAP transporter substrate-binding protein [Pseudomonadota bacterium]
MPRFALAVIAALAALMPAARVQAQEVILRLHQFLPPQATIPAQVARPWAESVMEASGGRIEIQHFDAMALGGRPPELYDQAIGGVADIVITLPGYTPGRFPQAEVFELPFMMRGSVETSLAFWDMVEQDLQATEFGEAHILGAWVHGPGVIHANAPVRTTDDLGGLKLRAPTRVVNDMVSELGATAVGMPLPGVPEALSKGVIDGTVIPWEVTPALRLSELVNHATEFPGEEALYTATFVMAMNKAAYEGMPEDLRAILDAQSGEVLTRLAAEAMLAGDAPARDLALENGTEIVSLSAEEIATWKEAAAPVRAAWLEQAASRDIDGAALVERAEALIEARQ